MAENEPKKDKPEEKEPKSAGDMTDAARTFIEYLKHEGFAVDEAICVLALASSLMQVELLMKTIIKNAKVVAVPMPFQKPSDN